MEKLYGSTDLKYPVQHTSEWNGFVLLASRTDEVSKVTAFDITEDRKIMATLIEGFLESRQVGVIELGEDSGLMLKLGLATGAGHKIFFDGIWLIIFLQVYS